MKNKKLSTFIKTFGIGRQTSWSRPSPKSVFPSAIVARHRCVAHRHLSEIGLHLLCDINQHFCRGSRAFSSLVLRPSCFSIAKKITFYNNHKNLQNKMLLF